VNEINEAQPVRKSPEKVQGLLAELEQAPVSEDPAIEGMRGVLALARGYLPHFMPQDPDQLDQLLLWLARTALDCRSDDAERIALVDLEVSQ